MVATWWGLSQEVLAIRSGPPIAASALRSAMAASARVVHRVPLTVMLNRSPLVSMARVAVSAAWSRSSCSFASCCSLVAGVGAFEPLQAGDLGVEFGVLEDAWVSGGERLDFGVGQRCVADVFDLANVEGAAHDLGDEPGFAFYGLPEICVKARLRHVADHLDLAVEVALA